jgi:sodium-dependent dicarboxylate transporter 2/3/5
MADEARRQAVEPKSGRFRMVALVAGIAVFVAMLLAPPPAGLSVAGWRVAAVAVLMASWWLSEAVPVSATTLLPILLMPMLGIMGIKQVAAAYANPLIFLFLGGFLIALALERWRLHRRIALKVLTAFGTRPAMLVAGFMLATGA